MHAIKRKKLHDTTSDATHARPAAVVKCHLTFDTITVVAYLDFATVLLHLLQVIENIAVHNLLLDV